MNSIPPPAAGPRALSGAVRSSPSAGFRLASGKVVSCGKLNRCRWRGRQCREHFAPGDFVADRDHTCSVFAAGRVAPKLLALRYTTKHFPWLLPLSIREGFLPRADPNSPGASQKACAIAAFTGRAACVARSGRRTIRTRSARRVAARSPAGRRCHLPGQLRARCASHRGG